jgi:hypothetical protein
MTEPFEQFEQSCRVVARELKRSGPAFREAMIIHLMKDMDVSRSEAIRKYDWFIATAETFGKRSVKP